MLFAADLVWVECPDLHLHMFEKVCLTSFEIWTSALANIEASPGEDDITDRDF